MRRRHRARLLAGCLSAVAVLAAVVASPEVAGAAGTPVTGGGSSFAQLEMDQWRADTSHAPFNLSLDYTAQGSSFGRSQYLTGQLDYGVSDIEFQPEEADQVASSKRKNFVYVPVSAGGVGFMYNLVGTNGARITNLHLTSDDVCRAFTEPGMYWDDPNIVSANPGAPLPHDPIRPVVRSDGSGTSYVLSAYCITVAPQRWQAFISLVLSQGINHDIPFAAGGPTSNWPIGIAGFGSANAADGVADYVANSVSGKDTITYNAAGFATERGFPNAFVQNAAGVYHTPDADAVSVALAYANPRADGTFDLNYNKVDPAAYFPSTYSYFIAQTAGLDPGKGQTMATFLDYAVTLGQARAVPLGYARLSSVLVNEALDHIQQVPGAPPRPTNLGNPPPPPQTSSGVGAGARPPGSGASGSGAASGAGKGPAATPGGAAGAGSASSAGAAGTTATTLAGAGATGVAGNGVTESADGAPKVDVKNLPAAKVPTKPIDASTPISNKEVLWMFLLGFVLLGAGSLVGVGTADGRGARRDAGR